MSQQERKILIPKKRGGRYFRGPLYQSSVPSSAPNQSGIKRNLEPEQNDQPPSKKPNRNSSFQQQHKPFQPHKSHSSPKNLAERRLQNLRNNLETKRRLSEGLPSPAFASNSANKQHKNQTSSNSLAASMQNLRQSLEINIRHSEELSSPAFTTISRNEEKVEGVSPLRSTPVQLRLIKKRTDKTDKIFESPSVSNIQVARSNSTSSEILKNNVNVIDNEEMDWTEIDENAVVNDIIDLRKEIDYNKELPVATEVNNTISFSSDGVFIVVDTNIFLSQLSLLSQLKDKVCTDLGRVTVMVPWMVIQELDYMKESHCSGSMMKAARRAVHYINTQLANKDPHFTGQSVMEAAKLEMSSKNPDDGILFCCMQLVEKRKFTILLSNDINLRNKALVNNVQAYNSSDIITNLNNLKSTRDSEDPPHGQSVQKIKIALSNVLTHIIEYEMKEAYGDVWKKMAMMHPPFTTEEALNCLVKYWVAVFSMSLQKQCKLKIEEFNTFLKLHRNDSHFHSTDFNKFVEYTLSLCIYLKNGFPKYRNLVNDCITNVQKCAER